MKTPSVKVETGASFGCRSRNQPSLEHDMLNIRRTSSASSRASRPVREHDHVHRDAPDQADQRVLDPDDQLALLHRRDGPVGHLGHPAADESHPFLEQAVVELLVAFAEAAHVDVEVVDLRAGLLLDQVRELQRVHAADARAVLVVLRCRGYPTQWMMPTAFGVLAVLQQDLAAGRARGVVHVLELEAGEHVRVPAVAVFAGSCAASNGWNPVATMIGADLDLLDAGPAGRGRWPWPRRPRRRPCSRRS